VLIGRCVVVISLKYRFDCNMLARLISIRWVEVWKVLGSLDKDLTNHKHTGLYSKLM
jgi:hypothetical protein